MNFNITTIFGFKLQLTVAYYEPKTKEFTALGLNLIKTMEM